MNLPVRCKAGESAVHSADCSETETHIHANKQKVSDGVNLYFAIQTGRKKEKERISQRSLEKKQLNVERKSQSCPVGFVGVGGCSPQNQERSVVWPQDGDLYSAERVQQLCVRLSERHSPSLYPETG